MGHWDCPLGSVNRGDSYQVCKVAASRSSNAQVLCISVICLYAAVVWWLEIGVGGGEATPRVHTLTLSWCSVNRHTRFGEQIVYLFQGINKTCFICKWRHLFFFSKRHS